MAISSLCALSLHISSNMSARGLILSMSNEAAHFLNLTPNRYYTLLLKTNWVPDGRVSKLQYQDPTGSLMMLPSDIILRDVSDGKVHANTDFAMQVLMLRKYTLFYFVVPHLTQLFCGGPPEALGIFVKSSLFNFSNEGLAVN